MAVFGFRNLKVKGGHSDSTKWLKGVMIFECGGELALHRLSTGSPRAPPAIRVPQGRPGTPMGPQGVPVASQMGPRCDAVNRDLDVEGLCRGWMKRISELRGKLGDRLLH